VVGAAFLWADDKKPSLAASSTSTPAPSTHPQPHPTRARRAEAEQHLAPDQREQVEALRYALSLHAYSAMKGAQEAAPGGAVPRVAPALVSAVAPPSTPRGQQTVGMAAIKIRWVGG